MAAALPDKLDAAFSRRQESMKRLQLLLGPDGGIADASQTGNRVWELIRFSP